MRDPSGHRIGRNAPCWCGSHHKYKNCHMKRDVRDTLSALEYGEPQRIHDLQRTKARFGETRSRRMCLCPPCLLIGCSQQIVKAHTVQRSRALAAISEDHEVLTLIPSPGRAMIEGIDPFEPYEVATKQASVMSAFCAHHDKEFFSCVEDEPIAPTPQQAFFFHYRAECRELYAKLAHFDETDFIGTVGPQLRGDAKFTRDAHHAWEKAGVEMGLHDIKRAKAELDALLLSRSFHMVRYLWLRFICRPAIAAAGSTFPEMDFGGNQLQDLSDPRLHPASVSFTCIPVEGGMGALLAWAPSADFAALRLAASLLAIPDEYKADAILRFGFTHIENTYMKKSWWKSLSAASRSEARRLIDRGGDNEVTGADLSPNPDHLIAQWPLIEAKHALGDASATASLAALATVPAIPQLRGANQPRGR